MLTCLKHLIKNKLTVMIATCNCNSIFFNELNVLSWVFEEHKLCCHVKFPKRMLEYYFSKGFTIFECNDNNWAKIPNNTKQITYA